METKTLIYQWHFDPFIVCLIVAVSYLCYVVTGFKRKTGAVCFFLAMVLFAVAEFSPFQLFGMRYFSAHMISHVVILLICGPLLVLGLQARTLSPLHGRLFSLSVFLSKHSWVAWISGVGIMWFWHIPVIFDAAMSAMQHSFTLIPVLHGGSMLLAGMLFSWPIFSPFKTSRLQPLTGIVYLFTACISCSLLGLLITFAPLNTWHQSAGMNMAADNPWNLSAAQDQQAAGLIMWVPCCFVYLSGCLYLLFRWFAESGSRDINEIKLKPSISHE